MKLYKCMKSKLLWLLSLVTNPPFMNFTNSATDQPSENQAANNIQAPRKPSWSTVFTQLAINFCIFWSYIIFAPIIELGRFLWYFLGCIYLCAISLVYIVMCSLTLVSLLNPKLLMDVVTFKDRIIMRLEKIKGMNLMPSSLSNGFRYVLCYMGLGTPGKPGSGQKSKDGSASEPEDHSSDKSEEDNQSPDFVGATPAPVQQRIPPDTLQRVSRANEDLYHPCGRAHLKSGLPDVNECSLKHLKERLSLCVKEIQSIKGDVPEDTLACNQYKQRYLNSKEDLIAMYQISWDEAQLFAPEDDSDRNVIILLTMIARVVAIAAVNRGNTRKEDLANKYRWLISLYETPSLIEKFKNMSLDQTDEDRCSETGEVFETKIQSPAATSLVETGSSCEAGFLEKTALGFSQSSEVCTTETTRSEHFSQSQPEGIDLFSPRKRKGDAVAESSTMIKAIRKMGTFTFSEGAASLGSPSPTSPESPGQFWTSPLPLSGRQPNPLGEHQLFSPQKRVKHVFAEASATEQMEVSDVTSKSNEISGESILRTLSPPVLNDDIAVLEKLLQTKTLCSNYGTNVKEPCCYTDFHSDIPSEGEVCVLAESYSRDGKLDSAKYIHTVPGGENEDACIHLFKRSELANLSYERLSSNVPAVPFFVVCMKSKPLRLSFFDRIATSENRQHELRFLYDCNEQKNKFKLNRKVPLDHLRKDESNEPLIEDEPMRVSPGECKASYLILSTNTATFIVIFTEPSSGVKKTTCIVEVAKDLKAINMFFRNTVIERPDSVKLMPDEVLGGIPLNATLCSETHFFRHLIPLFSKSVTHHPSRKLQNDQPRSVIHQCITGLLIGARPKGTS